MALFPTYCFSAIRAHLPISQLHSFLARLSNECALALTHLCGPVGSSRVCASCSLGMGRWLISLGALDFAGGTVVHINAGMAALVAAFLLGQR